MVITLEKNTFAEAVHIAARFAERKAAPLLALSGIAIVAGDDGIKLRATNLETGIDLHIEGTIKSPGIVVLPAAVLREVSGTFSGSGLVTIEHAGDTALITTGAGKSVLRTLPAEDFPIIPLPAHPAEHTELPGALMKNLLESVVACASSSTVRPELASVYLKGEGGALIAAASDSFRLAEKKIAIEKGLKPFTALIPAKNAADILQTIPDEPIELSLDEHQCAFSWKGGVIATRLVAAAYPDYTQIIPKSFSAEATVLRKDFEMALRRVAVFSDTFQKVRVGFDTKAKQLSFSSRNTDVGESSEAVSAAITGESIELSFNHRYLAAPLALISTESVVMKTSGIGRPLVLTSASDASYLYLVMPMNQ